MTREHQVLLTAVGAAVRRLRDERGLSRRELAGRSGVSERFLAELESGQGNISVARLQDVARALGSSAGARLLSAPHQRDNPRPTAPLRLHGAGRTPPQPAPRIDLPAAVVWPVGRRGKEA